MNTQQGMGIMVATGGDPVQPCCNRVTDGRARRFNGLCDLSVRGRRCAPRGLW
jgi:hypothetical protein